MFIKIISEEFENTIHYICAEEISYVSFRYTMWKSELCLEADILFGCKHILLYRKDAENFKLKFEKVLGCSNG